MRASDIMTPEVVTVTPETAIHTAAKLLADNHISGLPVVDASGAVIGIVSEGDLLHRVEIGTGARRRAWWLEMLSSTRDLAHAYTKEHGQTVKDVMTAKVISVGEDAPLDGIADVLERHRIKRVPVIKDGKLVGIVSRGNLIRALASAAPLSQAEGSRDDVSIREAVLAELHGHRWALPSQNVIVADGVVHLWGVVESEEERSAIRVAAESVQGVKRVESHLEFPPVIPSM
jgi:CBS domain-containing protein